MVVYFKCLCKSMDKIHAKQMAKQGYEVRVIRKNPIWAKEARAYGVRLPFVVENGEARPI